MAIFFLKEPLSFRATYGVFPEEMMPLDLQRALGSGVGGVEAEIKQDQPHCGSCV